VELGFCMGFYGGVGLRLYAGILRSPLGFRPVFGARILTHEGGNNEGMLGAAAEIGLSQKVKDPGEHWDLFETEENSGDNTSERLIAVGGGHYRNHFNAKHSGGGLALGLGWYGGWARTNSVQVLLPLGIRDIFFVSDLNRRLTALQNSLLSFDFENVEKQIESFANRITLLESKLAGRGLKLPNDEALVGENHPLSSAGSLFHPQRLIRYAPALVPASWIKNDCQSLLEPRKGRRKPNLLLEG
jgi:hypothetical protein